MDSLLYYKVLININHNKHNMYKLVDKVTENTSLSNLKIFFFLVLQLSNVQSSQQPQTITIPAGSLQLGGSGQQIVQLSTPNKMQTTSSQQNGTVIMVRIYLNIYN
jgi:hypothetical protein